MIFPLSNNPNPNPNPCYVEKKMQFGVGSGLILRATVLKILSIIMNFFLIHR